MEGPKIIFTIPIFGGLNITETTFIGWLLIAAITCLVLWLTHDMQKIPTKKQVVAEMMVTAVNKLVQQSMGKKHMNYAPYIATIFSLSICGSLVGILGLRSMTADINVTMTWAFITFFLITFNKFKYNGFLGYFKGYTQPIAAMTPLNIISEFALPMSMGFRHFGNIAGGMVITSLLYSSLTALSHAIGLNIPIFQVGIPAVLSIYFDLFSSFMQAFIFIMLTLAFVGSSMEDTVDEAK